MAIDNIRRPKIVMVLYYYHPYVSGVSVYAKRIAEGLVKTGYEVTMLTSRYDKSLPKHETIHGVHIVRRPVLFRLNKGLIMPTFWLDIIWHSLKSDYVNLHLPLAESGLAAIFIPKRKMVVTYHCDIYLGATFVGRLLTFVSLALMRVQLMRTRLILTNTLDYFEHSAMREYIAKAKAAYPPVNANEFTPITPEPLFKRLKLKDSDTKIGFMGRIVYEKGINYLLEAIPYLTEKLPQLKIIIAGDYEKVAGGSIKEQLDQYIERYPDVLLFTGYLSDRDRNRFYTGLDVFVLPSIDPLESFGIVQVEAMLCGTSVVASDLPGVREVVQRTGYGRISRPKDPKDIARQILEVVKHSKKYKPLHERVAENFDEQTSINAYVASMPR